MRHGRHRDDPRRIRVRRPQECSGCGETIRRGDPAFWYPSTGHIYGAACGCADTRERDFAAARFDEEVYAW